MTNTHDNRVPARNPGGLGGCEACGFTGLMADGESPCVCTPQLSGAAQVMRRFLETIAFTGLTADQAAEHAREALRLVDAASACPAGVTVTAAATTVAEATAPATVYLCVSDDPHDADQPFPAHARDVEVTWAENAALAVCIAYIRADLVRQPWISTERQPPQVPGLTVNASAWTPAPAAPVAGDPFSATSPGVNT